MGRINCFLPCSDLSFWEELIGDLKSNSLVETVYLFGEKIPGQIPEGCRHLQTDGQFSTATLRQLADHSADAAYALVVTRETHITLGFFALERFLQVAEDTSAGLIYSDFYELQEGGKVARAVIDPGGNQQRQPFNQHACRIPVPLHHCRAVNHPHIQDIDEGAVGVERINGKPEKALFPLALDGKGRHGFGAESATGDHSQAAAVLLGKEDLPAPVRCESEGDGIARLRRARHGIHLEQLGVDRPGGHKKDSDEDTTS